MDAKIAKLKIQRNVACDQITRIQTFIDGNDNKANSQQLELRLRFLDKYFETFCETQGQLELLVPDEAQLSSRADMEAIYFDLKPQILVLIQGLRQHSLDNSSVNVEQSTKLSSSLKLRKVEIPIFNGDYAKWMEFHESFMSLVHNQENVDDITKFQYLRSSLGKIPYRTIESLELTAANYVVALRLLSDRYENKKIICQDHIRSLFSFKTIDKGSAEKIREIIDHFNAHLRALESLQRPVKQWDDLIVTMIYNKLDQETRFKWDDESPSDRLATLDELRTFLNKRCHTLESKPSVSIARTVPPSSYQRTSAKPTRSSQSSYVSTRPQYNCTFCSIVGHSIFRCTRFLSLLPNVRYQEATKRKLCINCLKIDHNTADCNSNESCKHCNFKHHSLLHQAPVTTSNEITSTSATAVLSNITKIEELQATKPRFIQAYNATPKLQVNMESQQTTLLSSRQSRSYVFLATAVVKVLDKFNEWVSCRVLLDSASQLNFITESLASRLGLKKSPIHTPISGVGDSAVFSAWKTMVTFQSYHSSFTATIDAHVLPTITGVQPISRVKIDDWTIPSNIRLADQTFNIPQKIDMLLGAELYLELLSVGQIKSSDNLPCLQNTVLGWIVSGKITSNSTSKFYCNMAHTNFDLTSQLDRFFKQEVTETNDRLRYTPQEEECEAHFLDTFKRTETGRFRVRLPFSSPVTTLGDSQSMAQRRFFSLEKRLAKDSNLKMAYLQFMNEYKSCGHMTHIAENEIIKPNYYLPHHCVLKPDSSSTRLRVVFDASAHTTSGISLNDILMVGPVVQNDLLSILIRFRYPKYVFSADISKMYRQIEIDDSDTHFQYIFWRDDSSKPLQVYRLTTVTYGTAAAPYIATRCLKQLAIEEGKKYPLAASIVFNSIYVDDCLVGFNDISTTLQAKSQLINMLDTAGMKLHKWCANDATILHDIPDVYHEKTLKFQECEPIKTLGMYWEPRCDEFWFHVNLDTTKRITKRTAISDIARIFDPLGLIAPVILMGKLFLQQLWQLRIDWDASLPQHLHTQWLQYRQDLFRLNQLKFTRHLFNSSVPKEIELHGFADASEKAYGASLYTRATDEKGNVVVTLLCAKSKVAPLHKITIPRLELCAAVLLVQLVQRVLPILQVQPSRITYWTDSTIVLHWLNGQSSSWKQYVANRVAEIQTSSSKSQWRHVDSKNNASDILSRGSTPTTFSSQSKIWFNGPSFLIEPEINWPNLYSVQADAEVPEQRKIRSVLVSCQSISMLSKSSQFDFFLKVKYHNDYKSFINVVAYINRFCQNCRLRGFCEGLRQFGPLTPDELQNALNCIVRAIQADSFADDLRRLQNQNQTAFKSKLQSLNPFIDKANVIRVGGRLQGSQLPFTAKHPILLPKNHPFTLTMLRFYHYRNCHTGPQGLLASVRQEFWPLNGRAQARRICKECYWCFKIRPVNISQLMGNLPESRVQCASPFSNVGVDFCGPFHTHYKIRGKTPTKSYLAVFVCFAVKAVHIELVTELTTAAFIAALKRFVSTRGLCSNIFSDNATNFVGARNELRELYTLFNTQQHKGTLQAYCQQEKIKWHFAPPGSPHFGGLYEAAIKPAKHHIKRIMGNASLTAEELFTLAKQVEAVLNSRPITPLSADPNDFQPLTPGHFLIGRPLNAIPEYDFKNDKIPVLKRWQYTQQLHQHFWARWHMEYLAELQKRQKWTSKFNNVTVGQLVIIKDDNMPSMKWRLGRVAQIHPGPDQLVRVVTLNTASGTMKRAVHQICPLPYENDELKCNDFKAGRMNAPAISNLQSDIHL